MHVIFLFIWKSYTYSNIFNHKPTIIFHIKILSIMLFVLRRNYKSSICLFTSRFTPPRLLTYSVQLNACTIKLQNTFIAILARKCWQAFDCLLVKKVFKRAKNRTFYIAYENFSALCPYHLRWKLLRVLMLQKITFCIKM